MLCLDYCIFQLAAAIVAAQLADLRRNWCFAGRFQLVLLSRICTHSLSRPHEFITATTTRGFLPSHCVSGFLSLHHTHADWSLQVRWGLGRLFSPYFSNAYQYLPPRSFWQHAFLHQWFCKMLKQRNSFPLTEILKLMGRIISHPSRRKRRLSREIIIP